MNKKKILSLFLFSTLLIAAFSFTNIIISESFFNDSPSSNSNETDEIDVNEEVEEASAKVKVKENLDNLKSIRSDEHLLLCNKKVLLSDNYKPADLVDSNLPFISYVTTRQLNKPTKNAATEMFNAAKSSGISLLGASGYRSKETQKNLYQSNVKKHGYDYASKYSAPPRSSEHETGYALDIVTSKHQSLTTSFDKTPAFKWLNENAHNFGFILRYPKGKENITSYNYEPWHYRYVGVNHAKIIKENNLTLEEYLLELDSEIQLLTSSLNN
ncbi:MAG: M15 family metallopeptidase [Clostridium sp.]